MGKEAMAYGIDTICSSVVVYSDCSLDELINYIQNSKAITLKTSCPTDFDYEKYDAYHKFEKITIFCDKIVNVYSLECEA